MICSECKKDINPWCIGTYDDSHTVGWLRCPACRYAWPVKLSRVSPELRRDILLAEQSRLAVEGLTG